MAWKCKEHVLWFRKGQVVDEIQDNWKIYFDQVIPESKPVEEVVVAAVPVPEIEVKKEEPHLVVKKKKPGKK